MTKVLSINYNTPELIYEMVKSFRQFYDNEILIVDGSNKENYEQTKEVLKNFEGISIHHFGINIHHGPGLAYGFSTLDSDKILVLDSDVIIHKGGFLELLENELKAENYGIGDIQRVITQETDNCRIDQEGFNVGSRKGAIGLKESEINQGGIAYLHPAFMLVNRNIVLQWDMPIKHGAPMLYTMKHIHRMGQERILQHCDWVHNDFRNENKMFFSHPWCGTVNKTGGYNLD